MFLPIGNRAFNRELVAEGAKFEHRVRCDRCHRLAMCIAVEHPEYGFVCEECLEAVKSEEEEDEDARNSR